MSGAAGKHVLFDESLMSRPVIHGGRRVFAWEGETGGELLKTSSGVYQRGRIGKKVEPGHAIVPACAAWDSGR